MRGRSTRSTPRLPWPRRRCFRANTPGLAELRRVRIPRKRAPCRPRRPASPRRAGRPTSPDPRQTLLRRPTGDRAALSDVDGDPVLLGFAEQLAQGGHAHPFSALGVLPDHQFRRVAREDHGHILADLEGAVGRDVQRDRGQGRVVRSLSDYVEQLHLAFLLGACTPTTLLDLGEDLFVNLEVLFGEVDEPDQAHLLQPLGLYLHRPESHLRGLLYGIAEDAGRDGWEGDGAYPVLLGEREGVAVAVCQ